MIVSGDRFSETIMMSECHNFLIPNFQSSRDPVNLLSLLAFLWIEETLVTLNSMKKTKSTSPKKVSILGVFWGMCGDLQGWQHPCRRVISIEMHSINSAGITLLHEVFPCQFAVCQFYVIMGRSLRECFRFIIDYKCIVMWM